VGRQSGRAVVVEEDFFFPVRAERNGRERGGGGGGVGDAKHARVTRQLALLAFPLFFTKKTAHASTLSLVIAISLYMLSSTSNSVMICFIRRIFTVFVDLRKRKCVHLWKRSMGSRASRVLKEAFTSFICHICVLFTTMGVMLRNNVFVPSYMCVVFIDPI